MAENKTNFISKWRTKPSFAGADDMHVLPPSCRSYKTALLGYTKSSASYRIDSTCSKIKDSSSWLPQAATAIGFSPVRSEQTPYPYLQIVRMQQQLKLPQRLALVLHGPSVCYIGGPFPLQLSCRSVTPATLTSLNIRLEGTCITRSRSSLADEKEFSEKQDIICAAAKNFSISIGAQAVDLMSTGFRPGISQNVTPASNLTQYLSSYTG